MIRRIGAEARAALGLPKKTGDCVAALMERIDHPRVGLLSRWRVTPHGCFVRLKGLFPTFANAFSSSAVSARSNTATPPIQPVKPTLRELWMTRPIVKGPPLPSLAGV
jgi:hypothetical protein